MGSCPPSQPFLSLYYLYYNTPCLPQEPSGQEVAQALGVGVEDAEIGAQECVVGAAGLAQLPEGGAEAQAQAKAWQEPVVGWAQLQQGQLGHLLPPQLLLC